MVYKNMTCQVRGDAKKVLENKRPCDGLTNEEFSSLSSYWPPSVRKKERRIRSAEQLCLYDAYLEDAAIEIILKRMQGEFGSVANALRKKVATVRSAEGKRARIDALLDEAKKIDETFVPYIEDQLYAITKEEEEEQAFGRAYKRTPDDCRIIRQAKSLS